AAMPSRLSALDASFLYLEEATTPMHVGGVAVFDRPDDGFDYDRLVELIEQRIALVPRYRQKVRHVPGNLARPVWVDDPSSTSPTTCAAPHCPSGQRGAADRAGRAPDVAPAGPHPPAVGDVPHRGPRPGRVR
ncbi:wax ester/triacylglycerol synthase domain-containing protein, partial [Pseudonocardia sp. ICBG601]|uniref:wax ester/triacylglycerol synthase domain-containing protein n=1 Tax=Pseudonocardia sp. ICBG601 TaxID=2846759 RepID=UPI0035AC028A